MMAIGLSGYRAGAQVSVTTEHNDIGRTSQMLNETTLTTANVNPTQFGKLFSQPVSGETFAQPLYVPQVTIPGKGVHNVVYIETYSDAVYAFDADSNGGVNSGPLWQLSLLTNSTPAGTLTSNSGVQGTPVIDLTTQTMYLVSSEVRGGLDLYRLHALDITTGAEKFGGPVQITGSAAGTGSGSSNGVLNFDPLYHYQRAGLLLLNGVVYFGFGSVNDVGPWHGWLFSYSAANLKQLGVLCTSPNGSGAGIWMGGGALAAEVNNSAKPYGRMFFSTGNGSYSVTKPYTSSMSYGMSLLDVDLSGGALNVQDTFTPYNEALLDGQDGDLGSGGPVLLPTQTMASGKTLNPLLEIGKSGMIYLLDRDTDTTNQAAYQPAGLGGFHSSDQVVQEIQTPTTGAQGWGSGVWGSEAYWNNTIYFGGTNPGASNSLVAYSLNNGVLSTTPTSTSFEQYAYPAPTPSISANGNKNGVLWVLDTHAFVGGGAEALYAYDATNLATLLYSSNANATRDSPGAATRETSPTIANGKVYVGAAYQFSVYGLLGITPTAPAPVISPASGTFANSQTVTIADAATNAAIYYTTDGSVPTVRSTPYSGPFKIYSSQTILAIASVTGSLQSAAASATYSSTSNAANPVFSLASGAYTGSQILTLTDATAGANIYYTVDGTTPTAASARYTAPLAISTSEAVRAVATAANLTASGVVSASYTIQPAYDINLSQGFSQAAQSGQVTFNGSTTLDDFRLQLTNGGPNQAGSAFVTKPVNLQQFTTDFTFQLSNPRGDGMTFTLQGVGPNALGGSGAGLGFVTIQHSVAIKFDLYSNAGEGPNSTGLYTYGNLPTLPAVDLSGSPIDLHSGNYINAHITYDGTVLTLTLTNPISLASWSYSWPINIPAKIGSNTGWVGFTGGTGGLTSSQKVTSWTYIAGPPSLPNYPVGFDAAGLATRGSSLAGSSLQLTNGAANQTTSTFYAAPVPVQLFTSVFDFTINKVGSNPVADGFTFVLQNAAASPLGGAAGGLGFSGMANSLAIKFDTFNNAGEGTDSTGVYLNGAPPTVPSSSMSSGLPTLASGDRIHAVVTYDGTTLTWRLQDMSAPNPLVYSQHIAINIPQALGSNTAFVGFTAASGDGVAIQNVLNWTFVNK